MRQTKVERTLSSDLSKFIDKQVMVQGWVNTRRDHGGLIFIDLRDHKGLVQLTIQPESADTFAVAEGLRDEFVVEVKGLVKKRDDSLINKNIESGDVEILVESIRVLNKSQTPPIQINSDQVIHEDNRLKYRYLDLRSSKMQDMLASRAALYSHIRKYMEDRDFTEVATPILANSSPEGARDFLVPSRVHEGKFYALPQAPQQFKQLLMVGGVHRYYQIATCFRDEDPRADRLYGDFYQLDLEMSFVQDGEVVRSTMEPLIKDLVTSFAGKKLKSDEIPRITYQDSMNRFGTDKPDLRYAVELVDLTTELKTCGFGVFSSAIESGGVVKAICAPSKFSRSQIDNYTELAKKEGAGGLPYMTIENGKATSSIAKFFSDEDLKVVVDKLGAAEGNTIFFGSDSLATVNKTLGAIRTSLGQDLELTNDEEVALAWIVDFPLYEVDEITGDLDFGHNPFSMPKGGLGAFDSDNTADIIADQYDMVMNGYEVCSGAVRNHNPDIMYKVFDTLGYDKQYVESKFGGMLNAFKYGAPPHAGCAFGLDRIFMVLRSEENIRDVVAFPKNGSGVDVMMDSPSSVDPAQLRDLNIG